MTAMPNSTTKVEQGRKTRVAAAEHRKKAEQYLRNASVALRGGLTSAALTHASDAHEALRRAVVAEEYEEWFPDVL